ncbi:leucine-rich repeat receptor protein kinase HPCA1-like [Impatiens glandulifera]|uniref:leucine-rich repeat receptor protein kinase HPCA1-like n=1 Tax=Impatiens glandulifera TaxID=253017 RepID=UPI001FB16D73|nr:leucine-rich repeat receptor protein kinase HPCA1-like [Impatiens glandulifera]
MGTIELIFMVLICTQSLLVYVQSLTNYHDVNALRALQELWSNTPPSWVGTDPCGKSPWEGINCTNSRIISITLGGMGIIGQLTGDIASLDGLQSLDLSNNKGLSGPIPPSIGKLTKLSILILKGCSFSGPIPDTLGSLNRLTFLSLTSNSLSGPIPPSLGNLNELDWLDIAENRLTGTIPVSNATSPGLDLLVNAKHFHFGGNQLNGTIPPTLFNSNMNLIHLKSHYSIIIGASIGGFVLVMLAILAGVVAFRQKKRAEKADKQNNPFASWIPDKSSGNIPQLKGAKAFTFEEVKKYSNNFSEANDIGSGSYGKVYIGTLPNGKMIAIKRAMKGSMQGAVEFKSEIELLSRVHHKNVVSLVGFCYDRSEQILVYEYILNGTLKDSLSGQLGFKLDWARRLRIVLGAARGLQYLHELVDPPIIHRDIKSNNILLDDLFNAKVADFGLSKAIGNPDQTHITTQVNGTMGYMDPEYYMTNQLTEKSDVYSFGVTLLELVTAKQPIEKGKYIVREVRQRMGNNIQEVIDPFLLGTTVLNGLEKFVDVALRCVIETADERPTMGQVVKEIEIIMQLAGLNPEVESPVMFENYEWNSQRFNHPYNDESPFVYSWVFPHSPLEPK